MIRIGPAGTGGNSLEGIKKIAELGLCACEIEFVRGVRMSNELAKQVGKMARENKIMLSVHAPYYINLASEDIQKRAASKFRILQSCERAHYLGATHVVFHPAYYGKLNKDECYKIVKEAVIEMQNVIKQKKWKTELAPETTGKQSQFGDLDELLNLIRETNCSVCIDFAHLKARNIGNINYKKVFEKIKHLKHIHSHFSGIKWGNKGELNHEITEENDIKELLNWIKKYKLDVTIINESPDPVGDSLKTLRML